MSKKYNYDELMEMTEEELDKLQRKHWMARDISEVGSGYKWSKYDTKDMARLGARCGTALIITLAVCKTAKWITKKIKES